VFETVTLALSIAAGAVIARWWALVLAVPAGLIAARTFSFGGFSDAEVGLVFGIPVLLGLAVGVVLGKGLRRLDRPH
jgi:hypothetical protein